MSPPRGSRKAVHNPVALSPPEIDFVKSLVLYEDNLILALDKPPDLSSQGGRGQVHTLDELLWAFARPGKPRPPIMASMSAQWGAPR